VRYPNDVRPPYPLSPNLCLTPAHFVIASDDSYSAATSTASTALPPIVLNDGGANNDRAGRGDGEDTHARWAHISRPASDAASILANTDNDGKQTETV